ncbi:MAG: chromosomal replication initiator protein DnaA [Gemmatimonadales bacterium]|nr:chromosomal replication initiator protein DnaA [Gemmatimonadales bacterium]
MADGIVTYLPRVVMEQLSPKDAWRRVLEGARREVEPARFAAFLERTEAVALEDGRLVVAVPDLFAVEYNERSHGQLLGRLAEEVVGRPVAVAFQVQEERTRRPQMDFFVAPAAPAPAEPAVPQLAPTSQPLNERYTFDNFVIGRSNELAAAAAQAAAQAPGKVYNPLFIYGATGLGKTHLMQAIAHHLLRANPQARILYVSAEQFMNDFIDSVQSRTMAEFRRRYRDGVDIFLVDDVHVLERKEQTQEEFFHTFNNLYEDRKQIVLTSDRPPKEVSGLEPRLVSRFEWGMVADIGQPDLEHRIAILRQKQEQEQEEAAIPDDVLRFVAEHVRSSVRELEGCLIKLLLYASLKRRPISIELAREALADKIRPELEGDEPRAKPSIQKVQEVVARRWGVTPEGLRSKARIKTLTVPRQIAMYLARELLQMQLVEIGQAFGGRDHSTVIHSVGKVERQMSRDRAFRDRVDQARRELMAVGE